MLKVNEFETDTDLRGNINYLFNDEANVVYTYDGTESDLLQNVNEVSKYIEHHMDYQRPRLKVLSDYYEGKTKNLVELTRRKEEYMADNRVAHDYASYISDFINGYFLGNPIQYQDDDKDVLEAIEAFNDLNDVESHNRSLGLDLSIYGKAYELMIRNQDDETRLYKSDAMSTFVIYDNTIERNSIAGVRYLRTKPIDKTDEDEVFTVDLFTSNGVYRYLTSRTSGLKLTPRENSFESHSFERMPITEFSNNERRKGDYEKVITLIDLYDNAESDTANYMSDLNDAMLLIKGNLNLDPVEVRKQKEANVLFLEPTVYADSEGRETEGSVDGGYIYKQYDVQGTEAYKDRLNSDIHMFTNTPNMKDDNFSGTQSGEAMKYKLFGLEQRTKTKEGLFTKGLRRRAKLLETILKNTRSIDANKDFNTVRYVYNRNLPKSLIEELKAYIDSGGKISQTTLMSLFSFFQDPELEVKKIEEDEKESIKKAQKGIYKDPRDINDDEQDNNTKDSVDKKE
ncbi:TPA: phage portal protein [Staphylococcus aureus]|uniref:phage portal protein n=1 Tax=Staphylococcus aureus TaxID=1280 RepID=UPI000B00987C|nr:phage portal protein [Staphylococcus aureus]MCC5345169.1 phage portal protein [Staphylococcus aureus]MCD0913466.1 phage portal protein [Staphylococcus aureus]NGA12352.1 phage portal protein [Staphylococcus aureus]NGB30292.1 phage portal protein [Staphylococcus aureus]NGB62500.1 phage portal protein [Staphylococcus aureus]